MTTALPSDHPVSLLATEIRPSDSSLHRTLLSVVVGEAELLDLDHGIDGLLAEARLQRVVPLLLAGVAANADTTAVIAATHPSIQDLLTVNRDVQTLSARLEHIGAEALDVLSAAGIEAAPFKGVAAAHLDYPDPCNRQFGDIDVLVRPADFAEAAERLMAAGWRSDYALPPGHLAFAHALALRHPEGGELDLHQHIRRRAAGLAVPTIELLDAARPFDLNGVERLALCNPDRLIVAAIHATTTRGPYRMLSTIADVLIMVEQTVDPSLVAERATKWGVERFMAQAVDDAYRIAGATPPEIWEPHLRGMTERRPSLLDHAYEGDRRRPVLEEIEYVRRLGLRGGVSYLAGYMKRDPDYDARFGRSGRRARIRYLVDRVRNRAQ